MEEQTIELGSGNVFADLALENPEELLLKAQLGAEIHKALDKHGLSESKAASALNISEEALASLRLSPLELSTGELLRLLNRLDQDVQVIVTPRPSGREQTAA